MRGSMRNAVFEGMRGNSLVVSDTIRYQRFIRRGKEEAKVEVWLERV